MRHDLTKFKNFIKKEFSESYGSKEIKAVKINKEVIILKKSRSKLKYCCEKQIYFILKNEDFLPKLKYYDDKNLILGITDVGTSILIFKNKHVNEYKNLRKSINKQIKRILDKLYDKYKLYHNDLREKNICIDKHNKIRLIDFDFCNHNLKNNEKKYFICS